MCLLHMDVRDTLAGTLSALRHSHRPIRHFFPAIKCLWSVRTAASFVIGATPPASVRDSLSGQLITNIDISVCAQGVREPGEGKGRCISDADMSLSGSQVCFADTRPLPCGLQSQNKQFAFSLKAEVHPTWANKGSRLVLVPDRFQNEILSIYHWQKKVFSEINQSQTIILLLFSPLLFKEDLICRACQQEMKLCWCFTSESICF